MAVRQTPRIATLVAAGMLLLSGAGVACRDVAAAQTGGARPATVTPDALDRLLAPIALYPDQLLAQILLCASNPAQVTELDRWLAQNATLKGTELQDAATVAGFEPSFVALSLFPQVVTFMAERLDWATTLGETFAADRASVFDSIQRLRRQARDAGALKSSPQQTVETTTTSGGQQVIVIEPANPQVIYVPQYDPQIVYVPSGATTVVVDDDDDAEAVAAGLIGFTAGIAIGAAIDNDYYYGPYGWHGGVHMYNDAWDDWYDAREDAREDWIDHREELVEERGERAGEAREQRSEGRTERTDGRQQTRTESQTQRTERQQTRQDAQPARTGGEARGHSGTQSAPADRSGTRSDAFSGYSSGSSQRAASSRGQQSRAARQGGGRRR